MQISHRKLAPDILAVHVVLESFDNPRSTRDAVSAYTEEKGISGFIWSVDREDENVTYYLDPLNGFLIPGVA